MASDSAWNLEFFSYASISPFILLQIIILPEQNNKPPHFYSLQNVP